MMDKEAQEKIPIEIYHRFELFWYEPEVTDILEDLFCGECGASKLTEKLFELLEELGYRKPLDRPELRQEIKEWTKKNCVEVLCLSNPKSKEQKAGLLADQILAFITPLDSLKLMGEIAELIYGLLGGDSDFDREGGYHPCADLADEIADQILALIIPKEKPPIIPYEQIDCLLKSYNPAIQEHDGKTFAIEVANAQRELCVKHYENITT